MPINPRDEELRSLEGRITEVTDTLIEVDGLQAGHDIQDAALDYHVSAYANTGDDLTFDEATGVFHALEPGEIMKRVI